MQCPKLASSHPLPRLNFCFSLLFCSFNFLSISWLFFFFFFLLLLLFQPFIVELTELIWSFFVINFPILLFVLMWAFLFRDNCWANGIDLEFFLFINFPILLFGLFCLIIFPIDPNWPALQTPRDRDRTRHLLTGNGPIEATCQGSGWEEAIFLSTRTPFQTLCFLILSINFFNKLIAQNPFALFPLFCLTLPQNWVVTRPIDLIGRSWIASKTKTSNWRWVISRASLQFEKILKTIDILPFFLNEVKPAHWWVSWKYFYEVRYDDEYSVLFFSKKITHYDVEPIHKVILTPQTLARRLREELEDVQERANELSTEADAAMKSGGFWQEK